LSLSCGSPSRTASAPGRRAGSPALEPLHWNNPFIGSHGYSHTAPPHYQVTHRDGVGNNATVTFDVRCIDGPPF